MAPDKKTDLDRPVYGAGRRVFGAVMGTVLVEGPQQALLLRKVLEDGMRAHAGRHEETFLAELHGRVSGMLEEARTQGWTGWEDLDGTVIDG